jgi:propanol-preferring alcohol dehydrogenase
MRNLTIRGSYVGSLDEMKELLTLMNSKPLLSAPLFERPMAEINEMLADLRNGRIAGRVIATN